jgi:TATA-box binding protein (TBP) (component of TFIID and TFIIIB)
MTQVEGSTFHKAIEDIFANQTPRAPDDFERYLIPQNVVCRFELLIHGVPVSMLPLALLTRCSGSKGFVYNQYKFKSLVIALQAAPGVKGTLLVYKSGKIVVAGSNSMHGACLLVQMFITEYLENSCGLYGYSFEIPKIENVVCSFDLRGPLNLIALEASSMYPIHYDKAQFSGLIMTLKSGERDMDLAIYHNNNAGSGKMNNSRRDVKAIVYSSGKGIMVGETSIEDAMETWVPLYHHLKEFVGSRDGNHPSSAGARNRPKGLPVNREGRISIKKTRRKKILIMGRRQLGITL